MCMVSVTQNSDCGMLNDELIAHIRRGSLNWSIQLDFLYLEKHMTIKNKQKIAVNMNLLQTSDSVRQVK